MFRFCRSKCHSHFKKRRNPRKIRWTKAFRKANGKEMVVDSTFDFEKKRNRPVRYDRDLVASTIQAMKRIETIKAARQERFYAQRMKNVKSLETDYARTEIIKSVNLIAPAKSMERERADTIVEKAKSRLEAKKLKKKEMSSE